QYAAEESLKDGINEIQQNGTDTDGYRFKNATRGALVAVEVKTGRILSMVSYPNYNPNLFAVPGTLTSEENRQYFNPDLEAFGTELIQRMNLSKSVDDLFPKDSKGNRTDSNDLYPRPFYNYVTQSLIPPGSTFKPMTAIAGLESGVITPTETINDSGVFNIHPETFGSGFGPKCLQFTNYGSGHGSIDVAKALEVSCNFYFYETGYRLYMQALNEGKSRTEALDSLAQYAWQFGLGVDPNSNANPATGIEIQENFGQTYNFTSAKNQMISYGMFELVDYLESGDYKGMGYTFVPLDFQVSDDDNDDVRDAKKTVKDKVKETLKKVGTDEWKDVDENEFTKEIKKEILNIMDHSDVYKQRVAEYEGKTGKTVNLDSQANTIAQVVTRFTINDKPVEITSPAQLIYASIGQGINNYTPLQLASYVSTIANGGSRYKLHLVDKVTDNDGNIIQEYDPEVLNTADLDPEVLAAVKDGMSRVNNEEGGTARAKFLGFPITTAGKTGTADFREDQKDFGRAPYATYVSFAPVEDPEIAVVAVVFDGGHGGSIAGAVRAVYEAYFKDALLQMDPDYAAKSASFKKYIIENPNLKEEEKQEENNAAEEKQNTDNTESSDASNAMATSADGNINAVD
ncbi:MAG: penicillin-binding transpeptidase domain-containing protein, partial [Clostridium sp.]|nr:penicillin-binding transpeptidase domain-containing protein [Clostridium sp.]